MNTQTPIFSTRDMRSKPVWGIWVFIIIFPVMAFLFLPLIWASLITGIAIALAIKGFSDINKTKNSYIDLYTDKIVGTDLKGLSFVLQYNEIIRCDFQSDTVQIYCSGNCYAVRTPSCEQQVINIIKKQQTLNAPK